MRKTLMLLSLGILGYTLYNRYGKGNPQVNNFVEDLTKKVKNTFSNISGNLTKPSVESNPHFDLKIESQISRMEGLTDEAMVGIND